MSIQAAVSGNSYKNNGGFIKKAGNKASDSPITASRSLLEDGITTQYGSKVVLSSGSTGSSGNLGTFNAVTTFAYPMQEGQYIIRKNTPYVNGTANTLLTSCASDVGIRRSIPKLETTRSLGSGCLTSWDYETGAITKGANAGAEVEFKQSGGSLSDDAASPTDAVPGELTYKTGKKLPVNDEYKPRTG